MAAGTWKQEMIFIKRDDNGVIIAISEYTPEDYEANPDEETSFEPFGD
ncbi:hypothetical protein ACHHV8_36575 [Paenibacillus sp. TAB 01]